MVKIKMPTVELLQKLFGTVNIKRFIMRHHSYMPDEPFHIYLQRQCDSRNITPAQVIAKAGIYRTFGHHIFNGNKNPSRDKVLQLAFGYGMDFEETQELLKRARKSTLHPKIMRDAVIIHGLEHGLTFQTVQNALDELKQPLIGKEGRYE
jgi:hypothetical protein